MQTPCRRSCWDVALAKVRGDRGRVRRGQSAPAAPSAPGLAVCQAAATRRARSVGAVEGGLHETLSRQDGILADIVAPCMRVSRGTRLYRPLRSDISRPSGAMASASGRRPAAARRGSWNVGVCLLPDVTPAHFHKSQPAQRSGRGLSNVGNPAPYDPAPRLSPQPSALSRELHREDGAVLRAVDGADAAAVELHQMPDDRESEPRASRILAVARARLVHAVEALEDAREVVRGNAGSLVRPGDHEALSLPRRGHDDPSSFGGVARPVSP